MTCRPPGASTKGLGPGADPFLKAATALASGDKEAFQLFEDAYVAVPSGPSNLIATEVLARTGAAVAVARRLVERPDGQGREGAGTLQTHLHYADCFAEAAEVGTVVYAADPPSKAQTAFEVACSWAKATDVDHAIEWLERAADDGFRAASLVDGEPDLEAVRADPRWPLLRARLGRERWAVRPLARVGDLLARFDHTPWQSHHGGWNACPTQAFVVDQESTMAGDTEITAPGGQRLAGAPRPGRARRAGPDLSCVSRLLPRPDGRARGDGAGPAPRLAADGPARRGGRRASRSSPS